MMKAVRTRVVTLCLCLVLAGCNLPAGDGSNQQQARPIPSTVVGEATSTTVPPSPTPPPPTPVIEVPTTFNDEGRTLYLDSESVRVGVDTRWGGAIRELWFEEHNLVNNYDGGRLIGVAFYDSEQLPASSHPNDTGWNPTPSDMYNHANPPLETSFDGTTLYLKHRYLQWFPNDKGGGPSQAIPTDIVVETWLRFFSDPQIVELRYRLTNTGEDKHAVHAQEFPFAYIRTPYSRYVTYDGGRPWEGADVITHDIPMDREAGGLSIASEHWAGLVNAEGKGLVLWAPNSYANFSYKHFNNTGPAENDSLYLLPRTFLEIDASESIETTTYLLAGDWRWAREQIYTLNESLRFPDGMDPFGFIDAPAPDEELSGSIKVSGWAIDDRDLDRIVIRADGETLGEATYGQPRPDVEQRYPGLPGAPNYGYSFTIDAGLLDPGEHTLTAIAVDGSGNTGSLRPGELTIYMEE